MKIYLAEKGTRAIALSLLPSFRFGPRVSDQSFLSFLM